jgi:hypothetical protein
MASRLRGFIGLVVAVAAGLVFDACGSGGGAAPSAALSAATVPPTALAPLASPAPPTAPTTSAGNPAGGGEAPRAADAFVDSAGINVHLAFGATLYATNFSLIAALLTGLNVRHIRDGAAIGQTSICLELQRLGAAGVHLDLITSPQLTMAQLGAYLGCTASAVDAVEAPNEYDSSGDPNWVSTLRAYQAPLYNAVKALGTLPVIAPSLTTEADYASVGSLAQWCDNGNMHDYFAGRNPGTSGWGATDGFGTYGALSWSIGSSGQESGNEAIVSTETGYSEAVDTYAVPAATKARYTMRVLLEHWNAHVARTYIYELADEGGTPFSHYGLVDASGNAKPAYTAMKNLLAHYADPGTAAALSPLAYTISAPASVHHTLLEKRNGTYVLTLWNEVPEWDPNALAPIAVAPQAVTLAFTSTPSALAMTTFADSGTVTTAALASRASIALSVTGSPTIIDITR